MTDKRQERILVTVSALLLIGLGLDLFLSHSTRLLSLGGTVPFIILTLIVTVLVYARTRLRRLAKDEEREETLARQEKPETALFTADEDEIQPFTAGRSLEQFERFVVPAVTPLLAILQLFFAWRLYRSIDVLRDAPSGQLLSAAFLGGQAFVLFLLSRYLLGLGRNREQGLLKGPGIYLGLTCFVSLLGVAASILSQTGIAQGDRIIVWIEIAALAFLGVENILSTLGEVYRPRKAAGETNTAYESRIGALMTDPATWVQNIAQAIDYQFGFSVSHTWFYRFLENALLPLIIFQLLVLYLLSCFVFLGPDEEGILERFGRPLDPSAGRGHMESGFHLKWPWPVETVRRAPTRRIHTIDIGVGQEHEEHQDAVLWTIPHHGAKETFLVAERAAGEDTESTTVPVNFLSVHLPIEYRITNIYHYTYNYAEPDTVLRETAYRSLSREAVSRGLFDMVGEGQLRMSKVLEQRIQKEADRLQLGIKLELVSLRGVHPPTPIADAFESVIGALEEKEAAILTAQAYTNAVLPVADADADKAVLEAEAYRARRIEMASSEAYRFEQRLKGYHESPDVFRNDIYLRTIRDALVDTRKYIISAVPSTEVIQFDFGEKLGSDLLDLGPVLEGSQP